MSDLTFNKVAGAVLATGLAIFMLREVSGIVFHHDEPEKAGYAITVAEATGGAAAGPELPPDWGALIPVTSIDAGKAVAAKCVSCHTFDAGAANGTGPNLYGTMGKKPGTHAGFAYSAAMTEYASTHPQWSWDNLNEFLKAPQKHIPGSKMTFVGLKKTEDRVAMIAYLHSLGSTLAVPAPLPAEAPAAPAEDAAAEGEPTTVEAAPAAPGATPAPAAQEATRGETH